MDYVDCPASTAKDGCPNDCQTEWLSLPDRWELAPYAEGVVNEVVAKYSFGTLFVVFHNGEAYGTKSMGSFAGTKLDAQLHLLTSHSHQGSSYKANQRTLKVLMRTVSGKLFGIHFYEPK